MVATDGPDRFLQLRFRQPLRGLDAAQLLVRQGDSSVVALDGERWIGPFADEARDALSAQLTQRLATTDVAGLAPSVDKPVLHIKV